ncbi:hypothetical protein [Ekhidna sp.]|uniref:hypothetical protein n=1 Tax=Ekhidna sp. TaxID=2608089 RepID=UPI003B5AB16F
MKLLREGLIVLTLSTIVVDEIYSQAVGGYGSPQSIQDVLDPTYQNTDAFYDKTYSDIKGSAYFFDDWVEGTILTEGQNFVNDVQLKYDVYSDALIYKIKSNSKEVPRKIISEFTLIKDGIHYRFLYFDNQGYVQDLASSSGLELFLKHKKEVKYAEPATGYNVGSTEDKFVDNLKLYFSLNDQEIKEFPNKKKDRYQVFDSILPNSKKWFKEKKLNIKKTDDLIIALGSI